ncbi:hypothetical protein K469DRAFT_636949 [Zopfia rhizophila CBS 207.26]|uniref:Peptidase S54 rhomboid domain-containing protein n=1 Tax=Zopfia rhizophila CBS 207.26 TaxID=1314779 RepID=A0A6A6DVA9_9PEZI|nr:hypothetical protein K469DRAFT_636949 [Zopfia rhizophila CBS 207.26]
MSNALPVVLLRPSCVLRPSTHSAHLWSSVTVAFSRGFCSHNASFTFSSRPSLLSVLQTRNSASPLRSLTTSSPCRASISKRSSFQPPNETSENAPKKRRIRIGPLPCGEIDAETIRTIFGSSVPHSEGNNVLRILHHRRVSGSLADYGIDNLSRKCPTMTHELALKGLEWLRQAFPIDEARAAEEWAEKEANRISYELWLKDPENADSKYNDPARVFRDQQKEIEEMNQQRGQKIGILHHGPSKFEENIERKRRKRLEAMAKREEEKERRLKEEQEKLASGEWVRTPGGTALMKPHQTTYIDIFGREQIDNRKEMNEHYQKKSASPFQSEEEMLKATTTAQRLIPMTAFVAAVCLLSYAFAHYYQLPNQDYRLWPDLSPTMATIAGVIGTNFVIFLAWRHKPLWPLLTKYFMNVPGYPRAVQAVTNLFSHILLDHFLANMFWLALVGMLCHDLVGRGTFMGTYVASGAVGSLASLYWANLGKGSIGAHSVGASGSMYGITALYLLLTDQETIKIPFVKDKEVGFYPKMLFAVIFVLEILTMRRRGVGGTMDHASHIGGMVGGMVVAAYLRWRAWDKGKVEDGVSQRVEAGDGDAKTVNVEALVREEVKEVKQAVVKESK